MRIGRLDGIRTVAVLMVIMLHHDLLEFGWMGVDLFFVLSGFLITGILRRTTESSNYWFSFYIKRATRILPPLLVLVPISYFATKHATISAALAYLFFAANIQNLRPHMIPLLGGLWSLSVEEHFYLLWPLAVYTLSRATLRWILIAVLVVEPLLRCIATSHFATPDPIYLLTPFRLDGLAVGSLLALMLESDHLKSIVYKFAGPLTATLVLIYIAADLLFPGFSKTSNSILFNSVGYSLVALIMGTFVAHIFLHPEATLSRFLSMRPLVWLGGISYGLYLFQSIVLSTMERIVHVHSYPAPPAVLHKIFWIDVPLIIGISWLSFHFYELPIMRWGKRLADERSK